MRLKRQDVKHGSKLNRMEMPDPDTLPQVFADGKDVVVTHGPIVVRAGRPRESGVLHAIVLDNGVLTIPDELRPDKPAIVPQDWIDWLNAQDCEDHATFELDWEDESTMGERPETLISNNPLMQQLWECMLRPLTDEEINTPVRSMGHAWQIPSPGILYLPEEIPS